MFRICSPRTALAATAAASLATLLPMTGCQAFLLLERADSAPVTDASSGDARAPDIDGATRADGGSDAAVGCVDAAFCASFDEPDALAAWSSHDDGVTLVDSSVSPPLQAHIHSEPPQGAQGSCTTQQTLVKKFGGAHASIHVAATIRRGTRRAFLMVSTLDPNSGPLHQFQFGLTDTDLFIYEQTYPYDPARQRLSAQPWSGAAGTVARSVRIDAVVSLQSLELAIEGERLSTHPLVDVSVLEPQITFGTICPEEINDVDVDDVAVWLD